MTDVPNKPNYSICTCDHGDHRHEYDRDALDGLGVCRRLDCDCMGQTAIDCGCARNLRMTDGTCTLHGLAGLVDDEEADDA